MKNQFLFPIKKILLVFIALLVFSCDPGEATYEYDSFAIYNVYGTITDELSSESIKNIQIAMQGYEIFSNDTGFYSIAVTGSPSTQNYTIRFSDQDGSMNGMYQSVDTVVDFSDIDFINSDGSLYFGEKLLELNINLKN